MSEEIWFSLGRVWDRETVARPWKPGDGLTCSWAGIQRRKECGPPAAVIDKIRFHEWQGRHTEDRTRRVACAEHLAGEVGSRFNDRSAAITQAEKCAREEIIKKYWKQYQSARAKHIAAQDAELLERIPEPLRPAIQAALGRHETEVD